MPEAADATPQAFAAARRGDTSSVMNVLVANPALVHATEGTNGWTLLHIFARLSVASAVNNLLALGALHASGAALGGAGPGAEGTAAGGKGLGGGGSSGGGGSNSSGSSGGGGGGGGGEAAAAGRVWWQELLRQARAAPHTLLNRLSSR